MRRQPTRALWTCRNTSSGWKTHLRSTLGRIPPILPVRRLIRQPNPPWRLGIVVFRRQSRVIQCAFRSTPAPVRRMPTFAHLRWRSPDRILHAVASTGAGRTLQTNKDANFTQSPFPNDFPSSAGGSSTWSFGCPTHPARAPTSQGRDGPLPTSCTGGACGETERTISSVSDRQSGSQNTRQRGGIKSCGPRRTTLRAGRVNHDWSNASIQIHPQCIVRACNRARPTADRLKESRDIDMTRFDRTQHASQ